VSVRVPPRQARRGDPGDTRERLIAATAREIERHGYHGTDSNRIARAAGYAPGTFYKHFADKRAALLAAHARWVDAEWDAIDELDDAARIVDFVLGHHRRWRGLRAAIRSLVATDPVVRRVHRANRRRQLARMGDGAEAALLLLEVERVADAVADGELAALGVSRGAARAHLIARVMAAGRRRAAARRRS
jgi:AcrR family transcriptional regulator